MRNATRAGATPTPLRICGIVPTYDNPQTLREVVERLTEHVDEVFVVDDGSGPAARDVAAALERDGLASTHHRSNNGGKGAAVKDGLRIAAAEGFSHALQVDADGQHDLTAAPQLISAARHRPRALILGQPRFDASAPRARLFARRLSIFWVKVELATAVGVDPQCGFRVYPVQAALDANARGDRMDFDIEIVVRMAWRRVPLVLHPVSVRYISEEEGGVSHFRVVRDNVAISACHARLALTRWSRTLLGEPLPPVDIVLSNEAPVVSEARTAPPARAVGERA